MTGRFDREYYRRFYLDPRTAVIRVEGKRTWHWIGA